MISRDKEILQAQNLLKNNPVVAILGARQVGKTTLANFIAKLYKAPKHYFDLENPEALSELRDPMLRLKNLKGLIVIDEVQRLPDLFPILRVLADRKRSGAKFLILGSASPQLLRQSSESLAGRIAYVELRGFSIQEVGLRHHETLWLRGGFPKAYLASSHGVSHNWRRNFIRTFLERDLPQLGVTIQSSSLHRFWSMLAHYHGQVWNASEFGRSFGVADTTVRNYLDLFTSALMIRQLQPWYANIRKRQVKSPKVYFADSGLLHTMLNLKTSSDVLKHPKVGASWEGFVIEQICDYLNVEPEEAFFWATHAGAELDLLIVRGAEKRGFEVKRTSSPQVTPSMRHAIEDLKLKRLDVIYAGDKSFPLDKKINAIGISRILKDL